MTVRTISKAQREARYPYLKRARGATATGGPSLAVRKWQIEQMSRPRPSRSSAAHVAAVARGCPASFPVASAGKPSSVRGAALMHRDIVAACKRAGVKPQFEIVRPGAVGHERCRSICVIYF